MYLIFQHDISSQVRSFAGLTSSLHSSGRDLQDSRCFEHMGTNIYISYIIYIHTYSGYQTLPKAPSFCAAFNTVLNRGEDSFRLMPHRSIPFNSLLPRLIQKLLTVRYPKKRGSGEKYVNKMGMKSCQVRTHQRLLFGVQASIRCSSKGKDGQAMTPENIGTHMNTFLFCLRLHTFDHLQSWQGL